MEEDKMKWMFKWHQSAVLAHANFVVWSWREQLWLEIMVNLPTVIVGLPTGAAEGKKQEYILVLYENRSYQIFILVKTELLIKSTKTTSVLNN